MVPASSLVFFMRRFWDGKLKRTGSWCCETTATPASCYDLQRRLGGRKIVCYCTEIDKPYTHERGLDFIGFAREMRMKRKWLLLKNSIKTVFHRVSKRCTSRRVWGKRNESYLKNKSWHICEETVDQKPIFSPLSEWLKQLFVESDGLKLKNHLENGKIR